MQTGGEIDIRPKSNLTPEERYAIIEEYKNRQQLWKGSTKHDVAVQPEIVPSSEVETQTEVIIPSRKEIETQTA